MGRKHYTINHLTVFVGFAEIWSLEDVLARSPKLRRLSEGDEGFAYMRVLVRERRRIEMETCPVCSGQGLGEFGRRTGWELGGPDCCYPLRLASPGELSARDHHRNVLLLIKHMKTLRGRTVVVGKLKIGGSGPWKI